MRIKTTLILPWALMLAACTSTPEPRSTKSGGKTAPAEAAVNGEVAGAFIEALGPV